MPNPFPLPTPVQRLVSRLPKGMGPFLAVGVAGLATHTGLFALFFHLGLPKPLAWTGGLLIATAVTWTLNRRLTFAASGRNRAAEAARYLLVTAVAQGISFCVFMLSGRLLPAMPPFIGVVIGSGVATLFSYTGQRFFTFAAPKLAAEIGPLPEIPVI